MNFKSSLLKLLILPKSANLIVFLVVFLSGSVQAGTFSLTYYCPPGLQICPPGLQICPPGLQICPPGLQICPPGLQICPPGL